MLAIKIVVNSGMNERFGGAGAVFSSACHRQPEPHERRGAIQGHADLREAMRLPLGMKAVLCDDLIRFGLQDECKRAE